MGRELKRVPMDFDWPIGEIWSGYLSPAWRPCPSDDCENGSTIAGAYVGALASLLLLVGSDATEDRSPHPYLLEIPSSLAPRRKPGKDAIELSTGLAGRAPRGPIGHDAIDRWTAARKIAAAAGLPEDWGTCKVCQGHAIHPDDHEASEAWEHTDPPEGDGYQLWNTTTEGHPMTPVFATLDELCDHAAEHCTTFADNRASAEGWRSMLDGGTVGATMVDGQGNSILLM